VLLFLSSLKDDDSRDQTCRKFEYVYVGMTRAINNLYVLHNKANKNPKNKFADEQGTVQMMEKNGY
jgi:hypothetical protein